MFLKFEKPLTFHYNAARTRQFVELILDLQPTASRYLFLQGSILELPEFVLLNGVAVGLLSPEETLGIVKSLEALPGLFQIDSNFSIVFENSTFNVLGQTVGRDEHGKRF